jgi:hypothetical protein
LQRDSIGFFQKLLRIVFECLRLQSAPIRQLANTYATTVGRCGYIML